MSSGGRDVRRALHSAYTFVRSVETNKAVASLTLDHMIQEQISRLKKGESREIVSASGEDLGSRTSRYDQLTELQDSVVKAVKSISDAEGDSKKLEDLGIYEADAPDPVFGTVG